MHDQTHTIPFHHGDHGTHDVVLSVSRLDDNYLLSCELPISGEVITAKASDCYAALQDVRRKTEGLGWSIHWLGARCNVWPTAMSREMGGGIKAYRLVIGLPPFDLENIFEPDSNPDGSSVADQLAYWQELSLIHI